MRRAWIAYAAVAAFLALFVVAPIAFATVAGASPWLIGEVLAHPAYRAGLGNALLVAACTTAIAFVLATPTAWLAARCRFRGRGIAEALLLAPLVLPPFVGAIGVAQLAGQYGAFNAVGAALGLWPDGGGPDWLGGHRFALVVALEALGLYPILHLTLRASFTALDPALIEAARSLGARWPRVCARVIVPLVAPGAFAGGAVVFVWSFTELGTPLMLGFDRHVAVQVFVGLADAGANRTPYALVLVMLAVAALVFAAGRRLTAGDVVALRGGLGASPRALGGWRALAAWAPFALVAGAALAPFIAVALIGLSRDWYRGVLPEGATWEHARAALAHPHVVPGIVNSLRFSAAATVLAVGVATFIAWCGARWRPRGWRVLDAVAMTPLAVPGVVMAFGFLALGTAALPRWLDPLTNPGPLLIVAYAVRRLPHALRAVGAGFAHVPPSLEEAAAACGAGPWLRARHVLMPLLAPSLAAAALLTFSSSMLEVSDSLVLAQRRAAWPITRVIYDLVHVIGPGPALACAFATWATLFLAACLAAAVACLRAARDQALSR
ncbi:MAG TPA: ABC transporter permease subunit [Planctomycetota bacterium]|nr:ABC transporter permease subunit [Planctomycetota bacterium]